MSQDAQQLLQEHSWHQQLQVAAGNGSRSAQVLQFLLGKLQAFKATADSQELELAEFADLIMCSSDAELRAYFEALAAGEEHPSPQKKSNRSRKR